MFLKGEYPTQTLSQYQKGSCDLELVILQSGFLIPIKSLKSPYIFLELNKETQCNDINRRNYLKDIDSNLNEK